jgi:hypothetical protein
VRAEFYRAVVFEQASALAGHTVDKEIVLLDFGGMSLGLLKLMSLFKTVNSVGSSYFPERTVLFFVLNAPRAFATLWSIVRSFIRHAGSFSPVARSAKASWTRGPSKR